MKTFTGTFALLFLFLPGALGADPLDLYTRVGTDPSPADLIANGTIVLGDAWSNNTVLGSQIIVNDALLEQQTGVLGSFSNISGVHIPIRLRSDDQWSRRQQRHAIRPRREQCHGNQQDADGRYQRCQCHVQRYHL